MGTSLTISGGGGGGGGGGGSVNPDGTHLINGITIPWASAGIAPNKPIYNSSWVLPDGTSNIQMWEFNGSDNLMTTGLSTGFITLYMNIWFYPQALGRILMTIQGQLAENTGYTHTGLEIKSDGTITGSFWQNPYITTANAVNLNEWNHIYFRHNGSQALLQLNGGTAVTQNASWAYPLSLVLGFGTISGTSSGLGNTGRYHGQLGEFEMSPLSLASDFMSKRAKYEQPQVLIYDDFTVEWWQKAESNGQNSRPWAIGLLGSSSGQEFAVSYENNGKDYFWMNGGYANGSEYQPLKNHYTNSWEHMALVRKDGELKAYSNGSVYMTWPYANQAIDAINANLVIGTGELASGYYSGYIKDFHIIKGYAKYTTNFTVPYGPVQPQIGSVFLLPVMASGTAFNDTVGNKVGTATLTPTYSEDDPWTYPGTIITAVGYGADLITPSPYPQNIQTGFKVSDGLGWSDYIIDTNYYGNLKLLSLPASPLPNGTYSISEETNPLTITINYGGSGGGVNRIEGRFSQYPASVALSAVKAGWTYQDPNGVTGVITNNAYITGQSVFLVVPNSALGTWTFTPPVRGGSVYFDTGDYIDYGASVDFAFDVDGIEMDSLSLYLDANNPASYSGTGSNWDDLAQGNFDFTLYGAPYYTAGARSSFNFNGTSQYATGPVVNLLPNSAYTKMVWFNLNDVTSDNNLVSSDGGGHFMFFSGGSTLWVGHANVMPYQGPGAFGSTVTFSASTWYCVAVTYSVANGISLYINGTLDNNTAMVQHAGNGSTNIACYGAGGNLLNGKIGQVLCYTKELTASEVLQNFNATRNRYGI